MTCINVDLSQPTCRICLQNNEEDMFSIYAMDVNSNNLQIYEKIEECSGVKIILHEKLPSLICKNCYAFLKISYKFRSICRKSNDYFQEFVISAPKSNESKLYDCNVSNKDENIVKAFNKSSNNMQSPKRYSLMQPPPLTMKTVTENSFHGISENEHSELYEEMWLDEDHEDNVTNIPTIAKEQVKQDVDVQPIEQTVLSSRGLEQMITTNTPLKTLGISSDGAAVISDKNPVANEKKAKKEKTPHICDICGNMYERRYTLESHMRRHRREKKYECEICTQAFHSNFELTRHMRKHTGSRPYICSYCKRAFGDRSTLQKHERIHRNERPYKCDECGKTFTYSSVLKSHILTHTGEKPYACELCGKTFARSHHLSAHLETLQHQNDPLSKLLLKQIRKSVLT